MIEFKEFPKIPQFRNIKKDLQYLSDKMSLFSFIFEGTIKLHGTNAAVGYDAGSDTIYCQSRKRIITPEDDNMGFAAWVMSEESLWKRYFQEVFYGKSALLFGEWCGEGIQKGVAISSIPKMFVIFEGYCEGWGSVRAYPEVPLANTYNIYDFPLYKVTIDADSPELATERLRSFTEKVEDCCPVGEALTGTKGTGEGVVWTCISDRKIKFKVKGEKHSVSKVKTLAEVDPVKLESIKDFVEYAVTENRLNQGIQEIGLSQKTIGTYIGWVNKDIWEEERDVLEKNNLLMKDVAKIISNKARKYYLERL